MFKDRQDAGKKLGRELQKLDLKEPIVFALPRGGVIIGKIISDFLKCSLDLVIARKIGHPDNSEYAIAAVTETGPIIENLFETAGIDEKWLRNAEETGRAEAKRRHLEYLGDRKHASVTGKTVIVADDGLATGLSMTAAIRELKSQKPTALIVAVPVAPADTVEKIAKEADKVVALHVARGFFGAVGNYYEHFPQVTDEKVIEILKAVS